MLILSSRNVYFIIIQIVRNLDIRLDVFLFNQRRIQEAETSDEIVFSLCKQWK